MAKSNKSNKRFFCIDGSARALLCIRGRVLKALVEAGHEVIACAAMDTCMLDIQFDDINSKYRKWGVHFIELYMQRQGINLFREIRTFWQLLNLMIVLKPDVVLCFSIKSCIYGSIASRLVRIPQSYSAITGLGYLFSPSRNISAFFKTIVRYFLKFALSSNTCVFFQNPDDQTLFFDSGLLRDRRKSIIVNGSGVDLDYFANTPLPLGSTTFLMIARIQYDKGVREYLEAAEYLKKCFPKAIFQLLGPFDDHPSAINKKNFAKLINKEAVEYLGGTPDVRPFLANCHVFVLPSYREGTPLSALEAMSVGRAIVTTDVPGCRETVIPGVNGYLVEVKNSSSLAEAMKKFLEHPYYISEMGKRSREIAESKYDVNKVVTVMMTKMGL